MAARAADASVERRVITLTPCTPYSLRQSIVGTAGRTRRRRGDIWDIAIRIDERSTVASVTQTPAGELEIHLASADSEAALAQLRHVLATDVDHRPFLERFRDDRLLGGALRTRPGLRPARYATLGQAMVAAFAGQLVTTAEAAATHRALVSRLHSSRGVLRRPPLLDEVAALPPAAAAADGLSARRAASLVRACRRLVPARLAELSTADAAARLQTERDIGPWTAGIVLGDGMGRTDIGRVGDLGLIRLCERLNGRAATADDTAALLQPYGEWQALASAHLLRLSSPRRRRKPSPRRRM